MVERFEKLESWGQSPLRRIIQYDEIKGVGDKWELLRFVTDPFNVEL